MKLHTVLILLVLLFVAAGSAFGQTSVINYQGRLSETSVVENGDYQFQFKLYDAAEGGNQIGSTVELKTLVTNGVFSTGLDFGEKAFNGEDRYLEISIRKTENDAYAPLTRAREKVNSVPYAIKANTATTAENVGGQTSTDISNSVRAVNNATSNNVGGAIVKRDDNGQIAVSGVVFPDGTVLKSGSFTGGKVVNQTADNIGGTGTVNRISKWMDATGTLGDSTISENSQGLVGIGNPNPTAKLSVLASPNAEMRFAEGASGITPSLSVISTPSSMTTGGGLTLATGTGGSSFVFSDNLPFYIVKDTKANVVTNNLGHGTLLFTVLPNGNVGAGVVNPTERFEANGNIKISGAGSKLIFPDGTFMTTAGGGSGGNMTGTSIITAVNDPSTSGLISDARVSTNLARLTGANVWSGSNIFSAGLSANNSLITNVGNPVNAGDAVNKIYADSNFVKFVPGAEQLSVGDANGTAPIINLRGGSTCCSGPGGHTPAWFKVFQNGSFVFTGNLGIGTSPWEGKGYRTSWHTYKGAFRSGYADNEWDDANVGFFSWAGGSNSTASGLYALAFGDTNFAESTSSIVFGSGNQVKGAAGFSAGAGNRVCDTYGVALGNNAKSGGPLINGKCDPDTFNIRGLAAFALGYNVTADQDHSFALGKFATNNGFSGTFIWSDGSATASADTFRNTANNEVAFRATGGFRFRTNLGGTTGCNLPAGSGVFNCTSSRFTKENFLKVEGFDVLSRLRKIPVTSWNYISEGQQVRHIGPMAEDFFEQFQLGTGNTSIGVQDLAGVSIAAVKELDAQLQEKNAEIEKLKGEINLLKAKETEMEKRLQAIEKAINQQK
ncbi:MAG TPA: tail fiber domain-containing protein [Pyrinomonadaceae bacterium]